MGLVDYPDSDESGSEQAPGPNPTPVSAAKTKPTGFEKAESGKIRLNLPKVALEQNDGNVEPPSKRAKTSGAFSGLSARLPAPKNANKQNPGTNSSGHGGGAPRDSGSKLGAVVNLRTGAAPGFDRTYRPAPASPAPSNQVPANESVASTSGKSGKPEDEVKLVGKPMMFRPLSVSKKSQTMKIKKPLVPTEAGIAAAALAARRAEPANEQTGRQGGAPAKVPDKSTGSLFGSVDENENIKVSSTRPRSNAEYKPLLDGDEEERMEDSTSLHISADTSHLNPTSQAQPDNLQTIASQLNLSASERRRLFGRDGQPDAVKIQQFNLAREYQLNNELRETQAAAPQQAPVRSIAPGKHSLQQLVNAATSQKDALEDSFAQGRKNKADAGSRYGWS